MTVAFHDDFHFYCYSGTYIVTCCFIDRNNPIKNLNCPAIMVSELQPDRRKDNDALVIASLFILLYVTPRQNSNWFITSINSSLRLGIQVHIIS